MTIFKEKSVEISTERVSGTQRIIPSRRVLVTDTAFNTCGSTILLLGSLAY
jgi:hypothetical protein